MLYSAACATEPHSHCTNYTVDYILPLVKSYMLDLMHPELSFLPESIGDGRGITHCGTPLPNNLPHVIVLPRPIALMPLFRSYTPTELSFLPKIISDGRSTTQCFMRHLTLRLWLDLEPSQEAALRHAFAQQYSKLVIHHHTLVILPSQFR